MAEQAEKLDNALPGGGTAAKKALIGVFCGFIAVFFLLILFLPKHEGELSPNERRILASRPDASFSNIISGGFSKQVDTWLQDHFPGRTFFVGLYSYLNRFTGRNPVESISLGRNSRLFTTPIADDGFTVNANSSHRAFRDRERAQCVLLYHPHLGLYAGGGAAEIPSDL